MAVGGTQTTFTDPHQRYGKNALKERSEARGVTISRNQLLRDLLFKEHPEVSARLAKLEGREVVPVKPKRVRKPRTRPIVIGRDIPMIVLEPPEDRI